MKLLRSRLSGEQGVAGAGGMLLSVLLACQVGLLALSESRLSPTLDEPAHVVAGLSWWWSHDSRLNFANPPLGHVVQTAAAAALGDRQTFEQWKGWQASDVDGITRAYDNADYAAARLSIRRARLGGIVFSVALTLYVYLRGKRWFGEKAALLAAAALVWNPLMLAHGILATLDVPATLGIVVALGELARYLESKQRRHVVTAGLALGAVCSIKYNALFLVLFSVVAVAACSAAGRARFEGLPLGRRLLQALVHVGATCLLALLVINATYLFQRTGWTVGRILAEPPPASNVAVGIKQNIVEGPLGWIPVPLPYPYVYGLGAVSNQVMLHGHGLPQYFLGELGNRSFWYYFPVMLLVKSPLLWLFSALACGRAAVARRGIRRLPVAVLSAGAVVYLVFLMTARLNIGVRHALPLVPIVTLLGAAAVTGEGGGRRWHAVYGLLLASSVGSCLLSYPFYLGYFNLLAGGAARERKISVIGEDWGQDVQALGLAIREGGLQPVHYAGSGHTAALELKALGIRPEPLGCDKPSGLGWVVLHDSVYVRNRRCYSWLPEEPDRWINNHVRLYRIPD